MQGIFNVEEFGVFSQALPNKTVKLKNKKYTGGKYSKVRLTVISVASAVNGKVPLLFTKKSQNFEMFQDTKKELDEVRDLQGLSKTVGSKIRSSES